MRPSVEQLQNEYAFIALGSNLGDSRELVQRAISKLKEFSDEPILQSSLWLTEPVDCPPGSQPFINAIVALKLRADESADSLLAKLQVLEKEFGRQTKKVLNEARLMDLDLITFRHEVRKSRTLVLPHPRAHLRRFVLEPMREICPKFALPGKKKSVENLLTEIPATALVKRIAAN
jgi:2-amino-4-hydroxy-6-hydroxymethyldihydropteridine diphosphokinase